ncbi:MAG: ATP-grasp domain-containing protein [Ignavibacterium sp.]|nr:ATP-grasp domain-containing protein [Ignavibacterium sp.]
MEMLKMENFNILFTSSGRRVALINIFKETLQRMGLKGKIVAADMAKNAPALYVADEMELVPPVLDESYISVLKGLCVKHAIKLLVPLIDNELLILSKYKDDFMDVGTRVLVSSELVNQICFDKRKTHFFFKEAGVETPYLYDIDDIMNNNVDINFPLIIKPAKGSRSIGVNIVNSIEELQFYFKCIEEPIIQEFVVGEEYTLDVFADFSGKVISVVPRLRIETRSGEVSKGLTVKNYDIINAGKMVVESLPGAEGCITVQCILTPDNVIKFIEINPRFGGGFPLSARAGALFPQWIIELILQKKIDVKIDDWEDGVLMLRYD